MEQVRRGRATAGRLPVRALAAWLALAAGVVALAAHAPVLVHRCLPADGLTGGLGVRLALLRADADCPSGTLALGGEPERVMSLLVVVAVPVVLAHALSLLAAACVVAGARLLVRAVGRVAGVVLPVLPRAPRGAVERPRTVVAVAVGDVVRAVLDAGVPRRGPPLPAGA